MIKSGKTDDTSFYCHLNTADQVLQKLWEVKLQIFTSHGFSSPLLAQLMTDFFASTADDGKFFFWAV